MHEHRGLAGFDHDECPTALALLGDQLAGRVRAVVELVGQPVEKLLVGFREEREPRESSRGSAPAYADTNAHAIAAPSTNRSDRRAPKWLPPDTRLRNLTTLRHFSGRPFLTPQRSNRAATTPGDTSDGFQTDHPPIPPAALTAL